MRKEKQILVKELNKELMNGRREKFQQMTHFSLIESWDIESQI